MTKRRHDIEISSKTSAHRLPLPVGCPDTSHITTLHRMHNASAASVWCGSRTVVVEAFRDRNTNRGAGVVITCICRSTKRGAMAVNSRISQDRQRSGHLTRTFDGYLGFQLVWGVFSASEAFIKYFDFRMIELRLTRRLENRPGNIDCPWLLFRPMGS